MQTFKVKFKNGHFYDLLSGNRIIPKSGHEFMLIGDEIAFEKEDILIKSYAIQNPNERVQSLSKKYNNNLIKIRDAQSCLYFRLGIGTPREANQDKQYVFKCTILEDLYLYLPGEADKNHPVNWRLCDCHCKLNSCIIGEIAISDDIHAKSLNQLFTNTVMFFFSLQRSGSCNPFNTFFMLKVNEPEKDIALHKIFASDYTFLKNLRSDYVSKFNAQPTSHDIRKS